MGYFGQVFKAACGRCGEEVTWTLKDGARLPREWTCECRALNTLKRWEPQPNIPPFIWIGHDHNRQMKLCAQWIPTEHYSQIQPHWVPPYSIRAFVLQASRHFRSCGFETSWQGEVMGEPIFSDICSDLCPDRAELREYQHPCHMISGFIRGQKSCPLWEDVGSLSQTDSERRFLYTYLNIIKDRQFPMLIPQARLGIAETRRPDFVAFVPLHSCKYKCFAIELDQSHGAASAQRDDQRDLELTQLGFQVVRVKPPDGKTFRDLKKLVELFDQLMRRADSDEWSERLLVAEELKVKETRWSQPTEDIPF
jgi:hypothetical protein